MIVSSPKNIYELNLLNKISDYFLIGISEYTNSHLSYFSLSDMPKLKYYYGRLIFRFDLFFFDKDIDKYLYFLNNYHDNSFIYYVTDIGLGYLLKEKYNITNIIYDPQTMVCNKYDYNEFLNIFLYVGVSNEFKYSDLESFNFNNMFYQAFGLRKMFHSKRKVASLYLESKLLNTYDKGIYTLVEQTRSESYLLCEDKFGSIIYRPNLMNYIDIINGNTKFIYLESFNVKFNDYYKVVYAFFNVLNNNINRNDGINIINSLNLNTDDVFKFNDTVYSKE